MQFDGGSLDMTNSEIAHNYDDLTDIEGYAISAMAGPTPNQVYMHSDYPATGREFTFYDMDSMQYFGRATALAVVTCSLPAAVITQYNQLAAQAAAAQDAGGACLVNMSLPITGGTGFYVGDDVNARPKLLSIRNSHLHDSLAAGVQLRGADRIVVTGNTIERAMINCIQVSFSAYWNEGGIGSNIVFANNTCIDTPYGMGQRQAAISVYTEPNQEYRANNTKVFRNVTIRNNVLINTAIGGIEVFESDSVDISGNTMYDPGRGSTLPPGPLVFGISAQISSNVRITDNVMVNSPGGVGTSGPLLAQYALLANSRSNLSSITLLRNSLNGQLVSNLTVVDTGPVG